MRGKVHGRSHFVFPLWITPAYAGKSDAEVQRRFEKGDHPRLCGEKWTAFVQPLYFWGSPPPMRGKD